MTDSHQEKTMTATTYQRLAIGVAVATVLFLILGMGALGIIGAGGRPDRMYLAVLAVGAIGTVVARLRPRGMAMTLAAWLFWRAAQRRSAVAVAERG
jgi:hypothetical protein